MSKDSSNYDASLQSDETTERKSRKPCSAIRNELKSCMKDTDCVKIHRMTPKQCLQNHDPSVPERCNRLVYLFFECKRSLLDNRTRFRGHKGYSFEYDSEE